MAAENIRGDTPKQSPPVVENEQFSDIILILDKMELLLQAVTKLDKNGMNPYPPKRKTATRSSNSTVTRTCSRVSSRTSGAS